jgi:nucleotide-binding universal stress UspA family protein
MTAIRTVLCPIDLAELSWHAFWVACALARDHGARLVVVHVIRPPPFVTYGELDKALQVPHGYRQELDVALRRFRSPDRAVRVEYRLAEGDPAREILHLAGESPPTLIVMGTHGRTGLGRLLLGSVAEQVLRRAPCPVVTVRTPLEEIQAGEDVAGEPVETTEG